MKHCSYAKFGTALLATAALIAAGTPAALAGSKDDGVMMNAWTHAKVRLALLQNVGADAMHIDIDVDGKEAKLTGTVSERATRELAKQYAMSVEGIDDVSVDLKVEEKAKRGAMGEATAELSDALLESKVKLALFDDLGTNAFGIEVESADGIVALSGDVEGDDRRDLAIKTAKDVTGVKKVRDLLKTTSS